MSQSPRLQAMGSSADITVCRPPGLSRRMFFHAYAGPVMVGYAHLSSRVPAAGSKRDQFSATQEQDERPGGVSYCLKLIEVNQNYRKRGIGSVLLEEIIGFCREQRVQSLYGEAKGDREQLRRWYAGRGFEVSSSDDISLRLD